MTKKTYRIVVEKVYRSVQEVELDVENVNKLLDNGVFQSYGDVIMEAIEPFTDDKNFVLDETNIRSIENVTDNEVLYED